MEKSSTEADPESIHLAKGHSDLEDANDMCNTLSKSSHIDEDGYTLDNKFTENVALYYEEAVKRKNIIQNLQEENVDCNTFRDSLNYDLILALMKKETFEGSITIIFNLTKKVFDEKDFFIDYHGLGIKDMLINNKEVSCNELFNGQRVYFPKDRLEQGTKNIISFKFKSKYRKDGIGLHYFKDSIDECEYVYSQFELFHAHRVFPCFDQPDLKAHLLLV